MCTKEILSQFAPNRENLIAILHEIQNNNPDHYIAQEDIKEIARYLKLSVGTVYGVISYYSMFSLVPRGKNVIKICESPVCSMKGSSIVAQEIQLALAAVINDKTTGNHFTIEHCQCLGHCQSAPVIAVNDKIFAKEDYDQIQGLILQSKLKNDGN